MKATTVLLVVFVVLTIIFASLSAFESAQSARTETVTSSTTLTVIQPSTVTTEQTKIVTTTITTIATYTSTEMTMASLCPTPYPQRNYTVSKLPNGTTVSTLKFPVLLLSPGTLGYVCVRYSNPNPSQPFDDKAQIWVVPATPTGVTGASNTTTLSIHDGNTQTVLYAIATGYGIKGTYGVVVTQICGGLPFAVGYAASELTPANFSWFFQPASCPPQLLNWQITGYGNMGVTILTYVQKY